MDVTIEWRKYGTLRDVFVFGEYPEKQYNKVPMLYATAVAWNRYKSAWDDLIKWQHELERAPEDWKKEDAETVKEMLKWRDFEGPSKEIRQMEQVLLYIGYASTLISVRLVDTYDAGAAIPLFFLNIPATDVDVLVGHITKPAQSESPAKQKELYQGVETALINELKPPLNERDKNAPMTGEYSCTHEGDGGELFNK